MLEEEDPWVRGSTASERLGYASSRGHARQPCREAAAVSNMVAMATWPRGTGSGRNSCRRGPRRPAPPPRARCQGDWPERGCAGGPGLLRPACTCARGLPSAGVVGAPATDQAPPGPQTCPTARLGGKKKSKSVGCLPLESSPAFVPGGFTGFQALKAGSRGGWGSSAGGPTCFLSAGRWAPDAEGIRAPGLALPQARPETV